MPSTPGDLALALWRVSFYVLMHFHWREGVAHGPPPFGPLEPARRMFALVWWVEALMPGDADAAARLRDLGGRVALLAAIGVAFPLSSAVYTLLAARHLLASIANCTDTDYGYVLLSLLTACSGAAAG